MVWSVKVFGRLISSLSFVPISCPVRRSSSHASSVTCGSSVGPILLPHVESEESEVLHRPLSWRGVKRM